MKKVVRRGAHTYIHTYGYLLIIATIITVFAALTTVEVSAVEFDTAPYKNGVTITGFNNLSEGETVTIPAEIEGKPVLAIGLDGVPTTTHVPNAEKIGELDLITKAKNLEVILPYAFYWCPNIKETIENKTVASVGEYAFAWCDSITSVNFPACVAVGDGAFFWTFNLKNITLQEGCSIGKGVFEVSGVNNNINYAKPRFETAAYEYDINHDGNISEDEKGVCITGFNEVSKGETVTIPARINGQKVLAIGLNSQERQTSDARNIGELDLTQAGYLKVIKNFAFEKLYIKGAIKSETIEVVGKGAFSVTDITSLDLPKVTTIGDYAFEHCTGLTNFSAPNLTSLGASAFYYCTTLTSLDLPKVTTVGRSAFWECTRLKRFSAPNLTTVGRFAFSNCIELTKVTLKEGCSGVSEAFYNGSDNCEITYV